MANNSYSMSFLFGAKKASSFNKTFSSVNKSIQGIVTGVAAVAGAKMGFSAIKGAVNTFAGFEQSMANVQALSMANGKTFQALKDKALEMGRKTSKTAQEAADALGYMSLAGWDAQRSMDSLEPVLRLSEAGQFDLARASDLVTNSMSAISIDADKLPQFLDQVAQTSRKSNTNIDMLMEAFINLGSTVKDIPLDETSAALGVLANRGMTGSEAGNSLNSLMANFKLKTGQAYEALTALGVSAYDSNGKFKGIQKTMESLNEATKGMTEKQRDMYFTMIGGKTQLTTLNNLMGGLNTTTADGSSEFDYLRKQIQDSDGALYSMADTMNATLTGAFARFTSATDDMKIMLVGAFEPYLTPLIDALALKIPEATEKMTKGLKDGIRWMELLFKPQKTAGEKLFAIEDMMSMTGMDRGKATRIQNSFSKGLSGKAGGIMEILGFDEGSIQKITTVIDSIVTSFENIKQKAMEIGGKIKDVLVDAFEKAQPTIDWIGVTGIPAIIGVVTSATEKAMEFGNYVLDNWGNIEPIFWGIVAAITAYKVIQLASTAATWIATTAATAQAAAQAFLNATFIASPIGWIVLAIGALVAVGVLLYKNWDSIKAGALALWEGLKEVFGNIGDFISSVFKGIINVFTGFLNIFVKGFNFITTGLNGIGFTIPDWVPLVGGMEFKPTIPQLPEFPMLAQGGIATKPTMAMIGEGREYEAILPLSKLQSLLEMNERNSISPAAAMIREMIGQGGPSPAAAGGVTYSPVFNLYGSAGKEEVREAGNEGLQNLNALLEERERQERRTSFTKGR